MIEVEVHQQLRAFLRNQGEPYWPHHLTMGRLVARALRLGRSVLIQTGTPAFGYHGRYRLSYLMPVLIWPGPAILVATEVVQQRLLMVEIPQLGQWMQTPKVIRTGDRWPNPDFQGLLITSPEAWLADRLTTQTQFPTGVPTIIDGVDDLETWALKQLTAWIQPGDWNDLMLAYPDQVEAIREARVQLTRYLFQRPTNPYECYLIESPEQAILHQLGQALQGGSSLDPGQARHPLTPLAACANLPEAWSKFWQQFQADEPLSWATISRKQGQLVRLWGCMGSCWLPGEVFTKPWVMIHLEGLVTGISQQRLRGSLKED